MKGTTEGFETRIKVYVQSIAAWNQKIENKLFLDNFLSLEFEALDLRVKLDFFEQ